MNGAQGGIALMSDQTIFALSVDWIPPATSQSTQDARAVDRLLKLLAAHRMSATWALCDRHSLDIIQRLAASGQHEVAVLGAAPWSSAEGSRAAFGSELTRRIGAIQALGLSVQHLVIEGANIPNVDLMLKRGISSLRCRGLKGDAGRKAKAGQPTSLAYGLHHTPASQVFQPRPASWTNLFRKNAATQICQGVTQAREVGWFHCTFTLQHLAHSGDAAWNMLERVLDFVAEHRETGLLTTTTVSSGLELLTAAQRPVPARSFLRKAA